MVTRYKGTASPITTWRTAIRSHQPSTAWSIATMVHLYRTQRNAARLLRSLMSHGVRRISQARTQSLQPYPQKHAQRWTRILRPTSLRVGAPAVRLYGLSRSTAEQMMLYSALLETRRLRLTLTSYLGLQKPRRFLRPLLRSLYLAALRQTVAWLQVLQGLGINGFIVSPLSLQGAR